MLLTLFFMGMLAITGQQLFGGSDPRAVTDRSYFGTFYMAVISMIQLSTQEGLLEMIHQGISAGKLPLRTWWVWKV